MNIRHACWNLFLEGHGIACAPNHIFRIQEIIGGFSEGFKRGRLTAIFRLIRYFLTLFIEIFKASYLFSVNVFKKEYVPTVFKISLKHLDPVRVAIVANSITLTPGTISIEIIDQAIYVMVLAKPGTPVKDLERPIRDHFEKLLDGEAS